MCRLPGRRAIENHCPTLIMAALVFTVPARLGAQQVENEIRAEVTRYVQAGSGCWRRVAGAKFGECPGLVGLVGLAGRAAPQFGSFRPW
jgi:hypothetical protein